MVIAKCPNSDLNFDKMLGLVFDTKSKLYPNTRMALFYFVCIWVRYALYSLVFLYRKHPLMPFLVGIGALGSSLHLGMDFVTNRENYFRTWWSKTFQLVNALILIPVCVLVYMKRINPMYMPLILFISLIGGVVQSLFIKFC
jgi:hypothetical protein